MRGKVAGVVDRRLFIDSNNNLILRYIVYNPGVQPFTTVDTISVDFGNQPNEAYLDRIGIKGATEVRSWGPRELKRSEDALRYVDFQPRVPTGIPAGIQLQSIHMVGTASKPFVGVRLTDGMAVATVYLWRKGKAGEPFDGEFQAETADGIRCYVQGNMTTAAKKRLAKLFIDEFIGLSNDSGTNPAFIGVSVVRPERRAFPTGNGLKW